MITSTQATELCKQQFSEALSSEQRRGWMTAGNADWYALGPKDSGLPEGRKLLDLVETAEPPTVVDIGASRGVFLEACKEERDVRAIGLTVGDGYEEADGIEWVHGDVQRPRTWMPKSILEPEVADLVVSRVTFLWLASPLRAMINAWNITKPGGHICLDALSFPVDEKEVDTIKGLVTEELDQSSSAVEFRDRTHKNSQPGKVDIVYSRLHLKKKSAKLEFAYLKEQVKTDERKVTYALADGR